MPVHLPYVVVSLSAMLLLSSCKTIEEASEEEATVMLSQARELLADGHYVAARDTIFALRQQYPTALETRRAAILTLDSVELLETRDSLQRFELRLNAAREGFRQMQPRINGRTNEAYYEQQRCVFEMEQHFDELCAKAKFYVRKIDIDLQEM
ncbi:MAG: hypothetical protein K6C30_04355 [Bacteroidaceae bacterium]|nr:hypothetical protein [Bacteroidaceae bacterium]